ncbi:hypothetical protein ILUMI_23724 [Ignelater luminosus]|uniref:Transposase n=1 Tax=Ignelater luminosus TaxID=2038154 RepID=A0A8K0CE16_IGNLU|nr:hypothetical protein ILUMI_23724 [Ignelater luminosus]
MQCHQEVYEANEEKRAFFCEAMMERANEDRDFLSSICFTDECTFTLNNEPNCQDCRFWCQENPNLNVQSRTQYPQKINVWAGMFKNHIIGPFIIEGNLNSVLYLDLLQNAIGPALEEVAGENQKVWFQHDGCPVHFSADVKAYLNNVGPFKKQNLQKALPKY